MLPSLTIIPLTIYKEFATYLSVTAETPTLWLPDCEELTHLKRPWCWEILRAEGEGDDRGWDGWMASPTQWTWVWVDSRSWWWTGRPGMMRFMGSQRVGHDWVTELNWRDRGKHQSVKILRWKDFLQLLQILSLSVEAGNPNLIGSALYVPIYVRGFPRLKGSIMSFECFLKFNEFSV